ncbi:putative ankyrin repeat-containing domain-containing protein [Rosa chinensis]|uniref:Putative ankyrin repeat-containing domain-containing protein n=1 Tax=Rosa chinensis TaxID=74649 RepID=A0A2P6S7L1_ROSCH|nr:putative ankyrin repeat-containing domain-containing protein [Rosa chinensis]
MKYITEEDLLSKDAKGNTAFCFAVAVGSVPIAKLMIRKNPQLPQIRGGEGMTTLYMATLFGHEEMAWFLYPKLIEDIDVRDRLGIFFSCIHNDLYVELVFSFLLDPMRSLKSDEIGFLLLHVIVLCCTEIALKMLHDYRELAVARDMNGETAVHLLARKPSIFSNKRPGIWKCFVQSRKFLCLVKLHLFSLSHRCI